MSTAIVELEENTFTYDGTAKKPQIKSVKIETDAGKLVNVNKKYYTVSYAKNIDPGNKRGEVIITGKDKFTGTKKVNFTINKRDIKTAIIDFRPPLCVYTGKAFKPGIESIQIRTSSGNLVNVSTNNYTISYRDNKLAGIASVIITGKDKFTGTQKLNFKIYPSMNITTKAEEIKKAMSNYDYCDLEAYYAGGSCISDGDHWGGHPCGLDYTFANSQKETGYKNTCCATYVSWVLRDVGLIDTTINGASNLKEHLLSDKNFKDVTGKGILPGDILYTTYPNGSGAHIEIAATKGGNKVYSAGSTKDIRTAGYTDRYTKKIIVKVIRAKDI